MTINRLRLGIDLLQTVCAPEVENVSDGQLLESFLLRRDEAAFAALVRRHGPMIVGVCRRVLGNAADADDAFQAVFLVLVRKAAALKGRAVLGAWLHGVARRTALKARTLAAQRRAKELAAARPAIVQVEEVRNDWLPLLDEQLSRLPDKYRLPIVLCDLEGRTRQEAALQLGWPEGTVAGRLARGRALLAKRLLRGAQLASGLWPGTLAATAAQTALAPNLVGATVRAAAAVGAGEAVISGGLSAQAVTLAEGVMRTMFWNKVKSGVWLLLAAGLLAAGGLTFHVLAGEGLAKMTAAPKPPPRNNSFEPVRAPAPPQLQKAEAVKGLQLTLAAGKAETILKADGSNAVAVPLILTFTNTGDKPLKLDSYYLPYKHITLKVSGPNGKSVHIEELPVDRKMRPPLKEDFPEIKTDDNWWPAAAFSFPGVVGDVSYVLLDPGEYRVKVIYANPEVNKSEFAAGSWVGSVTSNEILLTVLPAKKP